MYICSAAGSAGSNADLPESHAQEQQMCEGAGLPEMFRKQEPVSSAQLSGLETKRQISEDELQSMSRQWLTEI
ncbi:hypothetical protein CEXT_622671 [Caerostris extrusa]|uniref:Uncharacterized protein n=1 Tax=Caerostris extrusa TaxID=172846 RepID=A0AAV4N5E1_CAEEX|nr:hypothetical protein CEXT_622671 [Caerostris extrusa]